MTDNIIQLHNELADCSYIHGKYYSFYVSDPKLRHIYKASVRDCLLHHAVYRQLYPVFSKKFITQSCSCRINKGTHRALKYFSVAGNKVSKNNTITCWILQCDIKKFFDSIDHEILLNILNKYFGNKYIVWLLKNIVSSFSHSMGKGLLLSNLISQLLVNIYMN